MCQKVLCFAPYLKTSSRIQLLLLLLLFSSPQLQLLLTSCFFSSPFSRSQLVQEGRGGSFATMLLLLKLSAAGGCKDARLLLEEDEETVRVRFLLFFLLEWNSGTSQKDFFLTNREPRVAGVA
jgi:hypothetical protein